MRTKTNILTIAGDLFSERGYHATSMRELAETLGLKSASLYAHITSKEEILWEIVNRVADQFLAQAEAVPRNIPLDAQLALLVRGHLEVIDEALHFATVFFQEWKFLEPALRNKIKARRDIYEGYFHRVIEEGTKQDVFYLADTRLATLFVLSVLNWTYQWFDLDESITIEQLTDQYTIFIFRALKGGQNGLVVPFAGAKNGSYDS